MKKLLALTILAILASSCTEQKNDCNFSRVEITVEKSNNEPQKITLKGCYKISEPNELGLVSITGNNDSTKVYYDKASTILNIITEAGPASEWRARKGDNILVVEKKDTLGFIFGNLDKNFKGSLIFIK